MACLQLSSFGEAALTVDPCVMLCCIVVSSQLVVGLVLVFFFVLVVLVGHARHHHFRAVVRRYIYFFFVRPMACPDGHVVLSVYDTLVMESYCLRRICVSIR